MSDISNPYAPPKAALVDPVATGDAYFTVGTTKLALMSVTTLGFYELYWFYRNWKAIRERGRRSIAPFWRAFFAPLWMFSLCSALNADAEERHLDVRLPVAPIGILYFLLTVCWRLPDAYWLITFLSFIPMLPCDRAARRLNGNGSLAAPTAGRFSIWNIAGMVVGTALLVLAIVGTFMPDEGS